MAPKDQDTIQKKVESYTDTNVTGWSVMRNTLESHLEHLERGSQNISRHLPPSMTTFNITCHNVTIENFSIVGGKTRTSADG